MRTPFYERKIGKVEELIDEWRLGDAVLDGITMCAQPHLAPKLIDEVHFLDVCYGYPNNTRAGACIWERGGTGKAFIELHPALLRPGLVRERDATLLHEIAHWLDRSIYGVGGHGKTWKHIMVTMNQLPRRTHYIAVIERRELKVVAECLRCGAVIKRRKRLPRTKTFKHSTGGCGGEVVSV